MYSSLSGRRLVQDSLTATTLKEKPLKVALTEPRHSLPTRLLCRSVSLLYFSQLFLVLLLPFLLLLRPNRSTPRTLHHQFSHRVLYSLFHAARHLGSYCRRFLATAASLFCICSGGAPFFFLSRNFICFIRISRVLDDHNVPVSGYFILFLGHFCRFKSFGGMSELFWLSPMRRT